MIDESGDPLIAAVALHDRTAPPHAPSSSDDAAGHIACVRRRAHALRSARRRTTRWWRRDRAARRCLGPRERSKLMRAAGRRVRAQPGWCRTTDGAGPRMAPVHGWRRTTAPSRERRESALTGAPTPVPSGGSFAGRSSCGSSRTTDETSVCRSANSLLLRVDARLALALSTPPRASGSPPPKRCACMGHPNRCARARARAISLCGRGACGRPRAPRSRCCSIGEPRSTPLVSRGVRRFPGHSATLEEARGEWTWAPCAQPPPLIWSRGTSLGGPARRSSCVRRRASARSRHRTCSTSRTAPRAPRAAPPARRPTDETAAPPRLRGIRRIYHDAGVVSRSLELSTGAPPARRKRRSAPSTERGECS